jgi:dextranase
MSSGSLSDLRTAYLPGEPIVVTDLPDGTSTVLVRTSTGHTIKGSLTSRVATIAGLPEGTHALEVRSTMDEVLAEEFFSIRSAGEEPVMGFVTSFDEESRESVLAWLAQLRCTVVQVYDWMDSYSTPMPESETYDDPLGRSIDRSSLVALIEGIRAIGAVAQAYAPVCAADAELADGHPEWRLYRNDGKPESLGDLLQIMDPGNSGWREHWVREYGRAVEALGFNGYHLDTYGYPRNALNAQGEPVPIEQGYLEFVESVRSACPRDVVSFNQVNGVPRGFPSPASPSFRYSEVWPPNDEWRHLEGLLARSAGSHPRHGDTLALYPPVWEGDRNDAVRTAVLSEAIVTTLGANTLIWGDDHGVLCHPYYVDHETLGGSECETVLEWHRFGLRCRDLFREAIDTSWYELSDENASVVVASDIAVSPEPRGGALFCRVRRSADLVVVGALDLSGSACGAWSAGTKEGTCVAVDVSVLVDDPARWHADLAVLGQSDGRFEAVSATSTSMREGTGLGIRMPIAHGWSVLRLTPKDSL